MATYVSNRNGGKTDEQGHYRFQTKVWIGNVLSGLAVVQNSPLARNVLVPAGDLKIDYGQYAYTAWNDANVTVAISTADTTNPRIDRIIAYIDLAVALGTTNNPGVLKFVAVAGTPASSPTKASDATVNSAVGALNPWCEIATVRVEANATTIPNSKITDTRTMVTIGSNTVPTASLQDLAITAAKIAANAVTADKIATNAILLGTNERTSNVAQSGNTIQDIPGLSPLNVTIPAGGRSIEISAFFPAVYTDAAGTNSVVIRLWDVTATTQLTQGQTSQTAANIGQSLHISRVIAAPAAGARQYKATMEVGAGNPTILAGAVYPAHLTLKLV